MTNLLKVRSILFFEFCTIWLSIAERKSACGNRQNNNKIINHRQIMNRARPMAARLKKYEIFRIFHRAIHGALTSLPHTQGFSTS